MNNFIFDVDGTLTDSREPIDPQFEDWFYTFCCNNRVFLVSGSDYPKTVEQLGERIVNRVLGVFSCSGNELRSGGKVLYEHKWTLPAEARQWLEAKRDASKFYTRTGKHIEDRASAVNFSVVGRNANKLEREKYSIFDAVEHEREKIALEFNQKFPKLEARLGGEIGIDIHERGRNKSQIVEHFPKTQRLIFFADKIAPGGNDFPLASEIERAGIGVAYQVKNWRDTWERLHYMQEARLAE